MAQANLPTIYDNKPEAPKEKIVESVINGDEFVSRRRSLGRKIIDVLFNGDIQDVKSYVVNDVFIPAVKETIFEMVNKGLDMVLFGGSSRSASKQSNQTYISYNNYSKRTAPETRQRSVRRVEERSDEEELIFRERGPAELVLEKIFAIFEEYHIVTKADLNDILNRSGNFTDNNWGWTDLNGASVERVRGGYLLNLPKMKHLD